MNPIVIGGQTTLSATTTTSRVAVGGPQVVVWVNSTTVPVFIRSGDSGVVATTADNVAYQSVIAPNIPQTITLPPGHTYIAGITASGSATVYLTYGSGQ